MPHTARRSVVASIVGLVVAVGAGVCAAPASAAPVTVASPVRYATAAGADITSTTVDYDRATGRLAVTVVLRGRVRPVPQGGPNYSVLLFGPRNVTGGTGQAVLSMVSVGFPANGSLVVNPVGTAVDELVPVDVRYVRNRVEFRASDPRLKNLPLRFLQVQTSFDLVYIPTNKPSADSINHRFIGSAVRGQ